MAPPPPPEGDAEVVYSTGTATLRSSAHRTVYSKSRKGAPAPVAPRGPLPPALRENEYIDYDLSRHDLRPAVAALLRRAGPGVGAWPRTASTSSSSSRLEDFNVPVGSLQGNDGSCEDAQAHLAHMVAADEGSGFDGGGGGGVGVGSDGGGGGDGAPDETRCAHVDNTDEEIGGLLPAFDRLVTEVVLPHLKRRLVASGAIPSASAAAPKEQSSTTTFWYQRPPTLRLQPGPSSRYVRPHRDAEYGHQDGEVNFWMPLTDPAETGTTLWVESAPDAGDFSPLTVSLGQVAAFHGTTRKHHVPTNRTSATRMSLDFRVGVEGYFDPAWTMRGTKADHNRREAAL